MTSKPCFQTGSRGGGKSLGFLASSGFQAGSRGGGNLGFRVSPGFQTGSTGAGGRSLGFPDSPDLARSRLDPVSGRGQIQAIPTLGLPMPARPTVIERADPFRFRHDVFSDISTLRPRPLPFTCGFQVLKIVKRFSTLLKLKFWPMERLEGMILKPPISFSSLSK